MCIYTPESSRPAFHHPRTECCEHLHTGSSGCCVRERNVSIHHCFSGKPLLTDSAPRRLTTARQVHTRKPRTQSPVRVEAERVAGSASAPPTSPCRRRGENKPRPYRRDLWATGTTQQNGCCVAGRLRGTSLRLRVASPVRLFLPVLRR